MRIVSYVVMLAVVLLGLSFAILNAKPLVLHYYLGTAQLSLSLLLVLAIGVGVLLGLIGAMKPLLCLKTENIRLKHRIKHAEQEIENLRSIPIKDTH